MTAKKKDLTAYQLAVAAKLRSIWDAKQKSLGLTQDTVAQFLGFTTQGGVSHYLNGRTAIGFEAMFRWADLLRVHPYEIDEFFRSRLPHDLRVAVDAMVPDRSDQYKLVVYNEDNPSVPRTLHETVVTGVAVSRPNAY